MIPPLLYIWGDDELVAERLLTRFATALAGELGSPLERWDLRGDLATAATGAAQLHERLATGVLFGSGTLAVLRNPGALTRRNATRDRILDAIHQLAPGNALVIIEESKSDNKSRKAPGQKRLSDAIVEAGGRTTPAFSPPPSALAAWLEREAKDAGIALAPGTAIELANRLGARITESDIDRRFLSRIASGELEKLALRHALDGGPITAEDVRELVSETTPGSIFGFADAIGNRRLDVALATLERLFELIPEPVLLNAMHRRIRDLIEVGDRFSSGQKARDVVAATALHPFVVEKLQEQSRRWTIPELEVSLSGLVELDAMVKGAPGYEADAAQRRLAFTMWVRDHATRDDRGERRAGPG